MIKDNKYLKKQVTDLQHTCDKIKSLLEVTLGMKSNIDDKLAEANNEDVPTIFEQIPDFETLKISLDTKNLKTFVYEMLTTKVNESYHKQSLKEMKKQEENTLGNVMLSRFLKDSCTTNHVNLSITRY